MSSEAAVNEWPSTNLIPLPAATVKPLPIVRNLVDLTPAATGDENTLLGNRFLCRGCGLLVIGSAGIGKSTGVLQMGICWSIGRPCFGIQPRQALKILYVQAENDEGDLCEMRDGVLKYLGDLADEEKVALQKNFICVLESARTGQEFVVDVLEPLLKEHQPDLCILDPALSYLGGDSSSQEIVGSFLRNLLNPLLQKYRCGALIVHHTPKPNGQPNKNNKLATDYAYAGLGSVEWPNWARAVLVLSAKDDQGLRELRIAKRFRLGWKDPLGNPVSVRLLRQNVGGPLFYTELSAQQVEAMKRKLSPVEQVFQSGNILPAEGESVSKDILVARLTGAGTGDKICGRDKATKEVIPLLVEQGYLERKEVQRKGVRAEIHFVRTPKKPDPEVFDPTA